MKKIIFTFGIALLAIACSSNKSIDPNWRPELTNANFGQYPINYPTIIKQWSKKHFNDSQTINLVSISNPHEEYLVTNVENQEVVYGYSVCAILSGIEYTDYYKPFSHYWFFIRDNKIIEQRDIDIAYNKVIYRDHKINCENNY